MVRFIATQATTSSTARIVMVSEENFHAYVKKCPPSSAKVAETEVGTYESRNTPSHEGRESGRRSDRRRGEAAHCKRVVNLWDRFERLGEPEHEGLGLGGGRAEAKCGGHVGAARRVTRGRVGEACAKSARRHK